MSKYKPRSVRLCITLQALPFNRCIVRGASLEGPPRLRGAQWVVGDRAAGRPAGLCFHLYQNELKPEALLCPVLLARGQTQPFSANVFSRHGALSIRKIRDIRMRGIIRRRGEYRHRNSSLNQYTLVIIATYPPSEDCRVRDSSLLFPIGRTGRVPR